MTVKRLISLLEKLDLSTSVHIDLNAPLSRGAEKSSVSIEAIVQKDTTVNPGTNREQKNSRIILTTNPS
jgi:hypothetical protein